MNNPIITLPIGQTFTQGLNILKVVEEKNCFGCFYKNGFGNNAYLLCRKEIKTHGHCSANNRTDGKYVQFQKIG